MKKAVSLSDYAQQAQECLPKEHYDYFAGGAQDEVTLRKNCSAFTDIELRPRVLRGQFDGRLGVDLLGSSLSMPILVAPTAFHRLAHTEGEVATAVAAHDAQTLMMISMAATQSIEYITEQLQSRGKSGCHWLQLYIQPDRGFTLDMVRRAEAAGCRGLVVTVDSPVLGSRERDKHNQFRKLPDHLFFQNMPAKGPRTSGKVQFDSGLSWADIDWLQSMTDLPVILKGVMHPEDARIALEHNVSALIVSNHGGRQLDTVSASIKLLPDIAEVVGQMIPVIMDGGIRRGTDIVKALALGATAVAVGRPIIWGLTVAGWEGVAHVLSLLREELYDALMLCGCTSLASLRTDNILVR